MGAARITFVVSYWSNDLIRVVAFGSTLLTVELLAYLMCCSFVFQTQG